MENKDLMIYNAVANVAARIFASFDALMFQPGKYDVPAVLNRIKSVKAFQDADAETAANEIVKIEIDTFTCSFRAIDSFDLLKRLAAAYQIPTACRAQFTKKADAAPVAVSFRVFAGLKDLCSRISKDVLHPCFNYICVDTRRRALIVCDQYTLSAVPVPEMFVSEDAKETYLITPAVLKAGHGVCNIDTNGTATNGAAVSAVDEEIKYPNIARVLFAVPSEFITLGKKVFSELKKNVSAAAKFGKIDNTPVILKADAGANEIEIIGYRESETETNAPRETRRAVVSLPQPVPFAFAVAVDPERLGKVLAAEKMYLKDPFAPVCFVDETRRVFSVMYPGKDLNHTPYFNSAFEISVPAGALSVDAVAGTFAPVQDAPAAPFEDEETAPAVPAVSEETKITFISKNYVPVITEEIKNAVAVAAEYKYIPYYENKYGVRCSREHTFDVCAAELLLQRENLYIDNYALICGNGQTFAYISKHDEEINVNYDVAQDEETAAPADSVPAVSEDAQETAANVQDETPAVFAKVDEYAVNDENGNAVIFGTYAPQLGTDEETAAPVPEDAQETPAADSVPAANDIETLINNKFAAYLNAAPADSVPAVDEETANVQDEETAPAVQDEETAANVETPAVSLPVPVAAVYPLHAVYIDNVLHGVYFSKLLADEIFWNAFFAGRSVYPLQILSNETAPETERAAVAVSVAADSETPAVDEETANVQDEEIAPAVQDEETAAPADSVPAADPFASVWACMQETPAVQDAPAVPVDEETPAVLFSVPEDAQETAANVQDEETPAVLIAANFARRFRRVWQTAAAVLFLIICAAVPVAVSDSVPADSVPAVLFAADSLANVPAVSVPEDEETANVQDETAPAVQDAPDVANAAPADSVPAVAKKQPQPRRKRARRAVSFAAVPADSVPADSCKQFAAVPVAVSDSVPADSVPAVLFAADSLANVPAVSVPEDEETANVQDETAPAVQDAPETANAAPADSVPAVDEETAPAVQDEETAAPADSVPADSVPAANSPAPAVPAVQCATAAPVAPVAPIVIACFGN